MRYLPTTIAQAELDILSAPYLGGEFAVYMTNVAATPIGDLVQSAAGAATYTDNAATALPVLGTDLQVACSSPLRSTGTVTITFACTDEADAVVNLVATFAPPAWAANQSFNFQRGYATDGIPSVVGKLFKTITSFTSITLGAKNCSFTLWQLPILTDYVQIGCANGVNWNDKARAAIGVDCGMESDAFIKRGKTAKGELTIKHKLKGFADGLARFGGAKGTVMLIGLKDGQLIGDRVVFTQFVVAPKHDLPEGEGEANTEGMGKFAEHLFFVAPYVP